MNASRIQQGAATPTAIIGRRCALVLSQLSAHPSGVVDARELGFNRQPGKKERLAEFLGLLDTFEFWFDIVTP